MERDVAAGRGSSCPDFEAMVKSGDLITRTVRGPGRTLGGGVSRQDLHLERSFWRTEGRAKGQGEAGGSVRSLSLSC